MITCPTVLKNDIQRHYDVSTLFYRILWGPHIHHGLWHGKETAAQAQLQLTKTLASLAQIAEGNEVLDVGCGMGGSSIHLAKEFGCHVTGVTISRFQRMWATTSAWRRGQARRTRFRHEDAETFQAPNQSFDVIWSIECTEHLFAKEHFFQRAAGWLRPGGRLAICAWLAAETGGSSELEKQVYDVCEGFLCPSLGTADDYLSWFQTAGLEVVENRDWTQNVLRTWEICRRRVLRTGVDRIAPWIDRNSVMFLERFDTILEAYRSGAMKYGCFVAKLPASLIE